MPSSTGASTTGDQKRLSSNNPFAGSERRPSHDLSEDERLARRLQEEENARAHGGPGGAGDRGAADAFYKQQQDQGGYGSGYPQSTSPYPPQSQSPYPPSQSSYGGQGLGAQDAYADKGKGKSAGGFLGKLLGKASSSSKPGYGQPAYGQQGYPQQGYGGYGGQPGGYYGGPQQQYYGQPGRKKPGMGVGGAAALGAGGGLLGGVLLGEALSGDGGDGGGDYGGGDGGGDYGGDGGGDFGGGDGGGDFGGGDF